MQGPEGGLMGLHEAVFWKINGENPSLATDPDILLLGTQLTQASIGADINGALHYMPSTHFTEMKAGIGRHKSHATARYFTSQDLNAVQAYSSLKTSDDLCEVTLAGILEARAERGEFELDESGVPELEHGADNPLVVPNSRACNDLEEAGKELSATEDKAQEQVQERLFDVFVHTDVLQGVDSGGCPRKLRVDTLRVRMKAPGGDVGAMLNCLRNSMAGVVLPLTNILSHMALCLRVTTNGVNLPEIFSTGAKNNISQLTAEAQMLPAVFNVAERNDIRNVQWRGMTYDPRSAFEVRTYGKMLAGVLASRSHHYRIVTLGCNRDTKPNFRKQDTPMPGYGKTLELYDGIHYVRFTKTWLHDRVARLLESLEDEMSPVLQRRLAEGYLDYEGMLLGDETHWYLAVDKAAPMNSGILGQVNADIVPRYEKQPGKAYVCEPMLHFHMQNPIFNLWLRNNVEAERDPFFEFVEASIRPRADLQWMVDNDSRLSATALFFRKCVNKIVQTSSLNYANRRLLKQEEVYRAYGNSAHPVLDQMHNTLNSATLELMANTVFSTFTYNVRSVISSGALSELKNVARAMQSMHEYKVQGSVRGKQWVVDVTPFFAELKAGKTAGGDLMHDGVVWARFTDRGRRRLKLDLSWCNDMLTESLQDSSIATFCWQAKQWGSPLKVPLACPALVPARAPLSRPLLALARPLLPPSRLAGGRHGASRHGAQDHLEACAGPVHRGLEVALGRHRQQHQPVWRHQQRVRALCEREPGPAALLQLELLARPHCGPHVESVHLDVARLRGGAQQRRHH